MAVISGLIQEETDGTLSFGDYTLDAKAKLDGFQHDGDMYKVKTFKDITKLERNGSFVYESVPGTIVHNMQISDKELSFQVEGFEDAQITLELEAEKEYKIFIDNTNIGKMKTNLGGKLSFSAELDKDELHSVKVDKI